MITQLQSIISVINTYGDGIEYLCSKNLVDAITVIPDISKL